MRSLKKGWIKINRNKWETKNRVQEIENTVGKLALPPWVNNKKVENKKEIVKDEYNLNKLLTKDEFDRALKYTKNRSALDGIEYDMLKRLPEKYKSELLKVMNHCFEKGIMMKDWKMNQTIFIDKGNKKKTITMSSYVSKIMERMINGRLMWWSEKQGILDNW